MENLAWGLQMTVLGMGRVFLVLALLWGLLTLALALDRTPETTLTPHEDKQTDLPADLVAAISIAVLKHRSTLRLAHGSTANEDAAASRWVATGRTRQNASWQPRGK